jgi:hypothetical protein
MFLREIGTVPLVTLVETHKRIACQMVARARGPRTEPGATKVLVESRVGGGLPDGGGIPGGGSRVLPNQKEYR